MNALRQCLVITVPVLNKLGVGVMHFRCCFGIRSHIDDIIAVSINRCVGNEPRCSIGIGDGKLQMLFWHFASYTDGIIAIITNM